VHYHHGHDIRVVILYNRQIGGVEMEERKEDYRNRWQRENQERIIVMVDKGHKNSIRTAATAAGYDSLNAYINDAISEKMAKKP